VYLDDVVEADLDSAGFEPAHLPLIQRLAAKEAADIANEIRALYNVRPESQTPFEKLVTSLRQHLKLESAALGSLADQLEAPPVPWLPKDLDTHVGSIAARMLGGQFGKLNDFGALINKLKALGLPRESLKTVLRWVAPHWLSPETAGRLAAVFDELTRSPTGGWAIVNGRRVPTYTAKMFVYKALPFEFQCQVPLIESPTIRPNADYYEDQICSWLRREDEKLPGDEQVGYSSDNTELREQLEELDPFLFVPIPELDPATLKELRSRFSKIVFLVWTGDGLQGLADGCPNAIPLKPEIDPAREGCEWKLWTQALNALRG
jgi:hypothetical protein